MENLREKIDGMLNTFNECGIPEAIQEIIITRGINFNFAMGSNYDSIDYPLNCFEFSNLLNFCKKMNPDFDANVMLEYLWEHMHHDIYYNLFDLFIKMEKMPDIYIGYKRRQIRYDSNCRKFK